MRPPLPLSCSPLSAWLVVTAPLLIKLMPPLVLLVTKLRPAPLTVVVAVTLPIKSALKLWIRSLVAAFGLTALVVLVVVMMPRGLLHATVTGSMPEVEQVCASTLCGAPMMPAAAAAAINRHRKRNATTSHLRRCPLAALLGADATMLVTRAFDTASRKHVFGCADASVQQHGVTKSSWPAFLATPRSVSCSRRKRYDRDSGVPPAVFPCDARHRSRRWPGLGSERVHKSRFGGSYEKALRSRRVADDQYRRPRRQFGFPGYRGTQDPHRGTEELRGAVLPPDFGAEPLRLRLVLQRLQIQWR